MRCRFLLLGLMLLSTLAHGQAGKAAPQRGPVIDMHMHAMPADAYGPPPLGMCTPITMPVWDPGTPYMALMEEFFKHPACKDPVCLP